MNIIALFYRDKIINAFVFSFLLLWAVVATGFLTLQKKEVTLLQLQEGRIYPINGLIDIDKKEIKAMDRSFLISFVNAYYHFDIDHFEQNMEIARGFFSEEGWKGVASDVQQLRVDMAKNFLSQGAVMVEAKKLSGDTFKMKLKFYSAVGGETKISYKHITLTVRSRDLQEISQDRPYTYEVENVSEESI